MLGEQVRSKRNSDSCDQSNVTDINLNYSTLIDLSQLLRTAYRIDISSRLRDRANFFVEILVASQGSATLRDAPQHIVYTVAWIYIVEWVEKIPSLKTS